MVHKGILLAGGYGTRLYPATLGINKHLIPIYNKPMIYYSLSVLMLANIRDILIISTPHHLKDFQTLFEDGSRLGLNITYKPQYDPQGIAHAFLLGENFIKDDPVTLMLGDNIFYGNDLSIIMNECRPEVGANIFLYKVKDPERYGIATLENDTVVHISEKPKHPQSHWAITGLYMYDNSVVERTKEIKPSDRGELEITDVNKSYLAGGDLFAEQLSRGFAWLDTGTHDSLMQASNFIQAVEQRQGFMIGAVEEIAYNKGWIDTALVKLMAEHFPNNYGQYLLDLI